MSEQENRPVKGKTIRGRECTVEEFMHKYALDAQEAQRLHSRFGPSETELDLLMAAKRQTPAALQ